MYCIKKIEKKKSPLASAFVSHIYMFSRLFFINENGTSTIVGMYLLIQENVIKARVVKILPFSLLIHKYFFYS